MAPTLKLTILLPFLCLAVLAAQAQGPCSLQTFAGTFAFYEKGSSAIFPASAPDPFTYHWTGAFAPFVTVGEITMANNGVGSGFFWMRAGNLNAGLKPIPVQVTVTEMNADCTGTFSYALKLPGNLSSTTIVERFVMFDNGRAYRAIPTVIQNGVPTLTWVHEGYRISNSGQVPNNCATQTASGRWLLSVENLIKFDSSVPIFSDTLLLLLDVSNTGSFTGKLYEKLGPTGNIVLPVSGTTTVNPDCSFASELNIQFPGIKVTSPLRGVYFEQGKKLFGLNMNEGPAGTQFSFGTGVRISVPNSFTEPD